MSQSQSFSSSNSERIRLVVGLGNPGSQYEKTRHNVGFEVLEQLAEALVLDWKKDRKSKALVARDGTDLILVKPQTFMNLSGQSVARLAGFFKVPKDGILIVYDDVDTVLGKNKFKPKGSAGGHNGIKSIIACLGTNEFPRLKIGIGASGGKGEMVGHVLGRFSEEEAPVIEESIGQCVESVRFAVENGLSAAMNHFNRREKPKKEPKKQKSEEDQEAEDSEAMASTTPETETEGGEEA